MLTQALGQYDNGYQAECRRRYPGRFARVGGVAPVDPQAPRKLAEAAVAGDCGVRSKS